MPEKRPQNNIGSVLLELGRIGEKDIERALEHQRLEGCYFGQALVDLGIIEQEELDFSLASQAKLPYVEPPPGSIPERVASLVPAGWAQRHNAIPISMEDGWLTLLVDSPLKTGLADELARRTGMSVKLALCSAPRISNSIRQVYQIESAPAAGSGTLVSMEAFWTLATSPTADCWGLSARRERVTGWIRRNGQVERIPLIHNWLPFLDRLLSPPSSRVLPPQGLRKWRASVRPGQAPAAVMVTSLSGPGGDELLFVPREDGRRDTADLPTSSVLTTLRSATRAGPVVIGVMSPSGGASRQLVTGLPALLLQAGHRSVCLLAEGGHAISETTLVITLTEDGSQGDTLEFVKQLSLDAVGLEVAPSSQSHWEQILNLAPLTLLVLTGQPGDGRLPPGIDWLLHSKSDEQPVWDLVEVGKDPALRSPG